MLSLGSDAGKMVKTNLTLMGSSKSASTPMRVGNLPVAYEEFLEVQVTSEISILKKMAAFEE